jgi:hypothetical protein
MNIRELDSAVHSHTRAVPIYRGISRMGRPMTLDGKILREWFRFRGTWIWYTVQDGRAFYMVQPLDN